MKIFISCDIEGVGCVVRPEHSTVSGRDYGLARRLLTGEVNAAIEGAFEAGADSVLVADAHNVGLNILPEELDERVELVMGSPRPLAMMEGVDQGFDAVFLVGCHAKPGTADGVIAHNFHGRLGDCRLNGRSVGEMGLNAALAGLFGAPVALVTGDAATAGEARDLLPGVETVVVKKGLGAYAAQCLHPAVCRRRIREGALAALKKLGGLKPWRPEQPTRLELDTTTASGADQLERIPGLKRVGPLTLASEPSPFRRVFDIFHLAVDMLEQVPYL
jgi:D-amino peptidase